MKRICTLATVLFLGTAYAGQIEGIKEAENVPTAFSQMHVLALLVDFLFLNRYIESGALAPHSAVGRDRSPDSAMEEIERVRQS